MMPNFAAVAIVLALINLELLSPRLADDTRLATPLALTVMGLVLVLALPQLWRTPRACLLHPVTLSFSAYFSWCTLSLLWSQTPATGAGHVALLWTTLACAALLAILPPRYFVRLTLYTLGAILLASWMALAAGFDFVTRPDQDLWRFRGLMSHEQRMGLLAGTVILLATTEILSRLDLRQRIWPLAGLTGLALVTLLATQTRAFTAFLILSWLGLLLLGSRPRNRLLLLSLAAGITLTGLASMDLWLPAISRGEADLGLTGRVSLWTFVWQQVVERLWTGHGFASFFDGRSFEHVFLNFVPAHAHNMWLQVWFETGLPYCSCGWRERVC